MRKRLAVLSLLVLSAAQCLCPAQDMGGGMVFKRNFLVGAGSLFLPNLVIGGYNRFVTRPGWAQVTWDDMAHFYDHKLKWDTDWYWTNFVLHPYQGSLTYMGARAANFTPYESLLWATASSFMWEYFFETNAPSKNDLVYTSLGAFPVGEMLFRLSYALEEANRPSRFLANPVRLFTDPAMRGRTNVPGGRVEELSIVAGLGMEYGRSIPGGGGGSLSEFYPGFAAFELDVVYGGPYGNDTNIPYSQFELAIGGKVGAGSGVGYKDLEQKLMYDLHILSSGMLLARSVDWGDRRDTTLGIVLDYDFIWQSFYDLSSLAPGFAVKQRVELADSRLEWQWHLDALLLGTTDFYYYRRNTYADWQAYTKDVLDYRPYSYTIGGEMVGSLRWTHGSGHTLGLAAYTFLMYDFYNQLQDHTSSAGVELLSLIQLGYEFPVTETVRLGIANDLYLKKAFYDCYERYPDMFAIMYAGQVFVRILLV